MGKKSESQVFENVTEGKFLSNLGIRSLFALFGLKGIAVPTRDRGLGKHAGQVGIKLDRAKAFRHISSIRR
jgi:hypothetical protein